MDDRNKAAPTGNSADATGQARTSHQRRHFTVTAAGAQRKPTTKLPAPSKSVTKVHALGALPKYLKKPKPEDPSNELNVEAGTNRSGEPSPAEPVPAEPGHVVPPSEDEIERQTEQTAKLQRTVDELWDELGVREKTVLELQEKLQITRANLSEMENLMREHLHRRGERVVDVSGNQSNGKITLLLLKMTLDTWPHGCS